MADDAAATLAGIARLGAPVDWVIVDHYELDDRWERPIRQSAANVFVIDDLANRPHDTDVLLDSAHPDGAAYEDLVPPRTILLMGPRYILLRKEFFSIPQTARPIGSVGHLLLTFGGNDPLDATGLALNALEHSDFRNLTIDVTIGLANQRAASVLEKARNMANVTPHVQHPRPSELMQKADLCLGAGGTTTWERCYLGLPSLVMILADNQREFTEMLARQGVVRCVGDAQRLEVDDVRKALRDAIDDRNWRQATSRAGQALVDGKGVARVRDLISLGPHKPR